MMTSKTALVSPRFGRFVWWLPNLGTVGSRDFELIFDDNGTDRPFIADDNGTDVTISADQ